MRKSAALLFGTAAEHRAEDGGVTDDGEVELRILRERARAVQSGDARDHQHGARARRLGELRARDHEMRRGVEARGVDALSTGLGVGAPDGGATRADALLVGCVSLVGEAAVVFDDVDAALGEEVLSRRAWSRSFPWA